MSGDRGCVRERKGRWRWRVLGALAPCKGWRGAGSEVTRACCGEVELLRCLLDLAGVMVVVERVEGGSV